MRKFQGLSGKRALLFAPAEVRSSFSTSPATSTGPVLRTMSSASSVRTKLNTSLSVSEPIRAATTAGVVALTTSAAAVVAVSP